MLEIKLPANEEEFSTMMEKVDAYLREANFPVPARPIRGWFEICKALKLSLSMFPRDKEVATEGVYSGDDLTIRIFSWFDERYGSKLAVRMGSGRIAILVRGDPWEIRFPRIYGTVEFFISPNQKSSNQEEDLRLKRVPKCNILDEITDFPSGLARSLSNEELHSIAHKFIIAYQSMEAIFQIFQSPMVKEILSDIDSSVNHLLSSPAHYGLSKWSSLQVAEKSFKTYLACKDVDFPKHHRLFDLSQLAQENGLFSTEKDLIDKIQCSAGVRYGEENVGKDEAHNAHLLSIILSGRIAKKVASLTRSSN